MHFFSGSVKTKLDGKNRFVLPQAMRYGLIEEGELKFTIALGLGGSLTIYKRSDIEKIALEFQKKQHDARYQKFFTLFFSTLHHSTCDKLGRVVLPSILKKAGKISSGIVIAGVLNKIEIWPEERYARDLEAYLEGSEETLLEMSQEAFALLDKTGEKKEAISSQLQEEYERI